MPVTCSNDRRYARSRGADPDVFSSILAVASRFSGPGLACLLRTATAGDLAESDIPALESLLHHTNADVQVAALGVLDKLLGPGVLPFARELLQNPRFREKGAALHALALYPDPVDAPLVVKVAKSHLSRRRRPWGGATPVVLAVDFLEQTMRTERERDDFIHWLTLRWWMLSSDEQHTLSRHAPPTVNSPPRLIVTSADPATAAAVVEHACRALPRLVWHAHDLPVRQDRTILRSRLLASDAAIALEAESSRVCLYALRKESRPVIRLRRDPGLGTKLISRRFLRELTDSLDYLLNPGVSA